MSVVGLSDLIDYMGRELAGEEVSAASPLLVSATAELEAWLGRDIEIAEHTETDLVLYPDTGILELTHTPVRAATSVAVDGEATTSFTIDRSGVCIANAGVVSLVSTAYPVAAITYTAGLGEPAQSVAKSIIVARVARLLEKRAADVLGLESISVEGYSDKWFAEGFTDEEFKRMDRWRRRTVSPPRWPLPSGSSLSAYGDGW